MKSLGERLVTLLRACAGLFALLLVLAALYVSLGRELVPWVADYRDEVASRASAALGTPLRIGRLEGRWEGFAPLLYAHDVELGEGAERLRLGQLRVVPDVLGSLLDGELRLASLSLHGLRLELHQVEDGQWRLDGLPRREGALDIDRTLAQLRRVARVNLHDGQLLVAPWGAEPLTFSNLDLGLRSGARQRLEGRLRLPDDQPLAFNLRTRVDSGDWRASSAELYLSLPQSDWAAWLPAQLTGAWRLERLRLGGELWLALERGQLQRAVARLRAPAIRVAHGAREARPIDDLVLNAYFDRQPQGLSLRLDDLAMSLGETRWGESDLALRQQGEDWQLQADRLELGPLLPLLRSLLPLPEQADEYLAGLAPHGTLRSLRADYRPAAESRQRWHLEALLEAVGISPYHGIPGLQNVSGSIAGSLAEGELRLDSEGFALHLDHQFPQPWQYRHASGRLTWRFDEQAFSLAVPYARVDGDEGQLAVDMLLRLMRDPQAEDYLDLRVGMRDGDARYTERYLPTLVPTFSPELAAWLKSAIRAGRVEEGYFQYQGSVNKGAPPESHAISLYFKTADALLAFQPGWPELREARGEVFIEPDGVRVALAEGRLLDSRVRQAQAHVAHVEPGQVARLELDGQLASSVADVLQVLQQAPIGTAGIFAGWRGEGAVDGRLRLDIPLHKGQAPKVQVDFALDGARLSMANPALELRQIEGAFSYDSSRGLSAPAVRAQALGHTLRGKILAMPRGGRPVTRFEAGGRVALAQLTDWLAFKRPLPLKGSLPYYLSLTLDGVENELRVDSDLQGLAIDLPAPFGKSAGAARPSHLRLALADPGERRYRLNFDGLAKLDLAHPPGKPEAFRGELLFGNGIASLPRTAGLSVRGRLDAVDADAWLAAARERVPVDGAGIQQWLRGVDLQIGRLDGFSSHIDDLRVTLRRSDDAWGVDLASQVVKGRVVLPERGPIDVDLEHLRLPAASQAAEDLDPLARLDPRRIPALDLRIARLLRGDDLYGAFALKIRPNGQGIALQDLRLDLKGLQVTGEARWDGAPGQTRSSYKGRLQGSNLAQVLKAWNFAPNVTSERFSLDVDGNWPGSPAWLSFKRFSGSLAPSLRRGQFVEVEGSAQALRVFGLLNFDSIGRRLRLDFSDLLGKGLSYDRFDGLLVATDGVYVTRQPLVLEGPSSNLEMKGTLDMLRDRIDADLQLTLPLTNNLPLAALIVGAPAVGGALFVVDRLLGDKVSRFASVQYKVSGAWQDPQISLAKPF